MRQAWAPSVPLPRTGLPWHYRAESLFFNGCVTGLSFALVFVAGSVL